MSESSRIKHTTTGPDRRAAAISFALLACLLGLPEAAAQGGLPPEQAIFWIDHTSLRPSDPSVVTSVDLGGSEAWLVIESTTPGDTDPNGHYKRVAGLFEIPPGFTVRRLRICYELRAPDSLISGYSIVISSPDFPGLGGGLVYSGDLTDSGPVCVDSDRLRILPGKGPLLVSLQVRFDDTADKIIIRGLALLLSRKG